ncbi:MAG: FAD-binding oxidoreductase [Firmicutes bacterium]|nr:FAD-binding oxidoreductase [Bacillota bacterium]
MLTESMSPPPVDPAASRRVGSQLARLVGSEHVLLDPDELAWAAWDALDLYRAHGRPNAPAPVLAVVRPGSAQEVAQVLAWASRERLAVVPRGGGTGVMGAAIPMRPAVALDLTRLNAVHVHRDDMRIEAGAGATLARVAEAAAEQGLLFAHDPWSLPIATVGGAISTNGMGYLFGRYGKMADQVLGLEVALPDGTLIRTRPTLSGGPGPLLHKLFAGAEGIFGVITRAWLVAWPMPECRSLRSFQFSTFDQGFQAVVELFRKGLMPAVMDLSDSPPDPESPRSDAEREVSCLHLGFFGFREEVDASWARAQRVLEDHGAQPLGTGPADEYWTNRHQLAVRFQREVQDGKDWRRRPVLHRGFEYLNVELPISQVLPYRRACLDYLKTRRELLAGETGLWGRPEIFSIVIHDVAGNEAGAAAMARATDDLLRLAQQLGGTMEAIHGPGSKLQHLLVDEWGAAHQLIRSIKAALDSAGVLHRERWSDTTPAGTADRWPPGNGPAR